MLVFLFLIGDKMNRLGRLNVDEFLQVKDVPDVYAIGDCNDVPEIKLAYGAETQGKYVADNLKLKHEGKAMKPYNVNSTFTSLISCSSLFCYNLFCLHERTHVRLRSGRPSSTVPETIPPPIHVTLKNVIDT